MRATFQSILKNKAPRLFILSLLGASILCVAVFGIQTYFMNRRSAETIHNLGDFYMSGLSEQIAQRFGSTIQLRLAQVGTIMEASPAEESGPRTREILAEAARAHGFDALAFCAEDGRLEMLYGEEPEIHDAGRFLSSLRDGLQKMALATHDDGEEIILLGIPAAYPDGNGGEYLALVAALPVSSVIGFPSQQERESNFSYAIICRDGTFVTRDQEIRDDNYFERVETHFTVSGGEDFIASLRDTMEQGGGYSREIAIDGSSRHFYCSSLPYSEWFLLLAMPYGTLDSSVESLSRSWITSSVLGCLVILLVLLLAFAVYFRVTRSQLRALVEAQEEADRANRAKNEFLSNMGHDIRTPMNGIIGMTEIASANLENPEQIRNCLRKITVSSHHLLGLINDILDISKIGSGELTLHIGEVSLREIMQNMFTVIQPQLREKNHNFNVYILDVPYEIVCSDGVRLSQILVNLLGNAVKFTPPDGRIQVVLYEENSPKGADWVRTHLRVRDNGIGMSAEFIGKMFDSFVRADAARVEKSEGVGLGLTITKYIVDAMGGTIEVESAPGKGSEFHVTIDMQKAKAQENDLHLPDWRILVIENDEMMCESVTSTLKSMGVRAEWSTDNEQAVRMAEERAGSGEPYDMFLLDWTLQREDSLDTASALRKVGGQTVPILLLSGDDWGEIESIALPAGISGAIAKPLFRSTLFYRLRQFAHIPETAAEEVEKEEEFDFTGKRILLAEDNDLNWEIADELLSMLGPTLERAENGKICVDMFSSSPENTYDAILMDLRMPEMTGFEAVRAIRCLDRKDANTIPIIAMSADTFPEDIQRCLDCGMNAHTAKPIDVTEVARLLTRFLP